MVHRKVEQGAMKPKTTKKSKTGKRILGVLLGTIFVAGISYGSLYYFYPKTETPTPSEEIIEPQQEEPIETKPALINLQSTIEDWASSIPTAAKYGVIVYDLDNEGIVAEINADETFATASLYKLFVVYEGYRLVEQGVWDGESSLTSAYTINQCLDLAIRESNSVCAETLWAKIGREELEGIIKSSYNLQSSSARGLISTPRDMMNMMKIYYEHKELSDETNLKIQDSMLNQPQTYDRANCAGYCDWRQGLPSGFSSNVKVYNKVGWEGNGRTWKIYDDAAIINFPEFERNYIVIAMTENLSSTAKTVTELTNLASAIEESVNNFENEN